MIRITSAYYFESENWQKNLSFKSLDIVEQSAGSITETCSIYFSLSLSYLALKNSQEIPLEFRTLIVSILFTCLSVEPHGTVPFLLGSKRSFSQAKAWQSAINISRHMQRKQKQTCRRNFSGTRWHRSVQHPRAGKQPVHHQKSMFK